MKFNKWLLGLTLCSMLALESYAQQTTTVDTNGVSVTTSNSAAPPLSFLPTNGITGEIVAVAQIVDASGILSATNWAVAPYLTYSPSTKVKVGGGVLAVYNVPQLTSTNLGAVGAALGVDWLGSWSLISGNVTINMVTHPLANFTILPVNIRSIEAEPFALAGIGTPMSGGSAAAAIWDVGYDVKFGHWLGGQFGAGFTWGEWMNAGPQSGHRYHVFLQYSYKL